MRRRDFLASGAALGLCAASGHSTHAQAAWPQAGRTVKVIVPWPPGAANDALGRLVSQRLQEKLGASSIVENRTGASGLIGTRAVIDAEPDGYTLLASAFNTAVMPKVLKNANFDPETDLEMIARTAVAPLVCVISASRPERTLAEVIASARANPRNWNFAISSLGSAGHLATVALLQQLDLKIDLVPYRGTAPALQDLMSGSVQLLIDPTFALLPAASDETRVRAIGIASANRSVLAPTVPTMAEVGAPGFVFNSWYGIWAPKGTPIAIQEQINTLVQETMRDPAIFTRLTASLLEPVAESIADSRAFIKSEIARTDQLLKSINFEPM
jgi:tripartite-type tricarboxylate transporter receptor subunit TctC